MENDHLNSAENIEAQIHDVTKTLACLVRSPTQRQKFPSSRSKSRPMLGMVIAAMMILTLLTALNLSGLMKTPRTAVPAHEMRARAERLGEFVIMKVERFRSETGAIPASVEELGLTAADGARIEITGKDQYRVLVTQEDEIVTFEGGGHEVQTGGDK